MTARRSAQPSRQLPIAMQTENDYQLCASQLRALADPDRLRIVNSLLQEDKSVSALADALDIAIVNVSHHLSVLRAAQLVRTRKQGKFVIYSLPAEIVAASTSPRGIKTLDLGCCQLDIVQPKLALKGGARKSRSAQPKKSSRTRR